MLRHLLSLVGCGGLLPATLPPGLAFLFKLAWESKVRLPLLIAVAFMLTDYHLQLEINVDIHIRDEPLPANDALDNVMNEDDIAEVDILFEGIIGEDFEEEEEEEEEEDDDDDDDDDENEEYSCVESDDDDDDDSTLANVDILLAGLNVQMENLSVIDNTTQQI